MITKEQIAKMLVERDLAVARALVRLHENQTADEKISGDVKHHNGVGFTPADAHIGSSMAEFYLKNGYLTAKQLEYWRKPNKRGIARICKYAGQLAKFANAQRGE